MKPVAEAVPPFAPLSPGPAAAARSPMTVRPLLFALIAALLGPVADGAETGADGLFFEAEEFQVRGDGWRSATTSQTRRASLATALNGSSGDPESTAIHAFIPPAAGPWRLWVRHMVHDHYRGAFDVEILQGERVVGGKTFDTAPSPDTENWDYRWDSLDLELAAAPHTLRLRKHQNQNTSGYTRNVDCFWLTQDVEAKPDHLRHGPQVWVRISHGEGYEEPVYLHLFADHFRSPW